MKDRMKDKYNATGQLLDFIPRFYLWMIVLVIVWGICIGVLIWIG